MSSQHDALVAIFPTHNEAEGAIKRLQYAGFDMKKLSIIGRDYHTEEHVVGYYNVGNRVGYWGKMGAFWGGMWGLLVGSAFFFIPGVGPILIAGPLAGWVIGALEGAVVGGGLSALGAVLYSLGIPKDSVLQYETALKVGKFVLLAHGTKADVAHAKEVIQTGNSEVLAEHRLSLMVDDPSHMVG